MPNPYTQVILTYLRHPFSSVKQLFITMVILLFNASIFLIDSWILQFYLFLFIALFTYWAIHVKEQFPGIPDTGFSKDSWCSGIIGRNGFRHSPAGSNSSVDRQATPRVSLHHDIPVRYNILGRIALGQKLHSSLRGSVDFYII